MKSATKSQENENLLLYLFNTRSSHRTVASLHRLCPDDTTVDESLLWLIGQGYVDISDKAIDLTAAGLEAASQLGQQSQIVPPLFSAAELAELPPIDAHPLRKRQPRQESPSAHQRLHYLLAFATPDSIAPIPVYDGDVLGRLRDAQISLHYDDYVSGHQCRFKLDKQDNRVILSVQDLGSRNGTYVNDLCLVANHWHILEHGDRLRVGKTILIVTEIPAAV